VRHHLIDHRRPAERIVRFVDDDQRTCVRRLAGQPQHAIAGMTVPDGLVGIRQPHDPASRCARRERIEIDVRSGRTATRRRNAPNMRVYTGYIW